MLKKKAMRYFCMIISLMVLSGQLFIVGAASSEDYFAGNQLKQLGVLKGYPDGTLKLDQSITRSEVAAIMVRIRGYEGITVDAQGKDFSDVNTDFWGYEYVQNAYKLGIIQGYPDASFKPLNNISYAEVVAIMVNTLGYKEKIEGEWPNNYLNKAKELGIIPSDSKVEATTIITRGEMALIVWDTLLVKLDDTSILEQ